MKSIVEEASTITKAIDAAWQRADKPEEFSVRIFEHPQRNFFGFTVKSAKVGIFFQETRKHHEARKNQRNEQRNESQRVENKSRTPKKVQKQEVVEKVVAKPAQEKKETDFWTDAMVGYAKQWLIGLFDVLQLGDVSFNVEPQKYHLKVMLNKPALADADKSRAFYRSCSYLLLQALRNTCKRPLKGYKIIVTHDA